MDYNELFGAIKPKSNYSTPTFTIIYGNIGCGKTVLATTCSELGQTVLINFENRISHIDETENLRIVPTSAGDFREDKACTYEQFLNFLSYIEQEQIKFKYLIIDTLDEMFIKFLFGMLRKGEIQDKYYGRAEVYLRIWEIAKKIKDLGISIIATCHQKQNEEIDLLLTDALKSKVNMTVDNVFYLEAVDNDNRILTLKPSAKIKAKLTVKPEKYNDIPNEIQNPTWKDIIEVINA